MDILLSEEVLPVIFAALMGLAVLIYVILDGYDLGVGILMYYADPEEKDKMIASIGPFWDANETWLVLAVGIMLVAFPKAHAIVMTTLYLPVFVMLIGLILRGVAFDFRTKVKSQYKYYWNRVFIIGSLLTSLSQGFMLGFYIFGLKDTNYHYAFAFLSALCVAAAYIFVGSAWLIMKTEYSLQKKAVNWARNSLFIMSIGIAMVSLSTPIISERIFTRWFSFPDFILLSNIPIVTTITITATYYLLKKMPFEQDRYSWVPFIAAIIIFLMCFNGLAYSFFPYIIPGRLLINDAASDIESLRVIFYGVVIVLPCIIGYTIFSYKVFWGKVKILKY